jgi:hypothetical protein
MTDTVMEVASEGAIAVEWAQMQSPIYVYPSNRNGETGPPGGCTHGLDAQIIGSHPHIRSINACFVGWGLVHPLVSIALPHPI